ncbi:MAG: DUF2520 domain-containing protein [Salibacteraceae bacterium]
MNKKPNTVVIGLGNLGWNLCKRLNEKDYPVVQIIARKNPRRQKLAKKLGADLSEDISNLKSKAELIFVCVPDDKVAEVCSSIKAKNAAIVHCSGSVPLLELDVPTGVLYPFQTFTKYFKVEWAGVPIFVEASEKKLLKTLNKIAEDLSHNVHQITTEQRQIVHIAGVFGANFVNFLLYLSKTILDSQKIDFNLLRPLVEETVRKAFEHGPAGAQTGPAKRNDVKVIDAHLKRLEKDKTLVKFYKVFTEQILKEYNR